ncbi:MAG TPA: radical SAM protein [Bacteroidota bacterium]|nr:radical SAM protein [Bacteroidota bacterium]
MNKRRFQKALQRLSHLPRGKFLGFYLWNKLHEGMLRAIHSTSVAYPSNIMLELSSHCNLHCTTCPREYEYGQRMDKGYMELEQAQKIIDELWPYLDSIGLTGMGETFLAKDIVAVIDYIKSKNQGIIISASTNAVLPQFLETITPALGKIDTVQISIDGLNDVYERIRKNARFQTFDENLRHLVQLSKNTKTTLLLNMVVTKENYHQMSDMVEYADAVGIPSLHFALFNLVSVSALSAEYYQFYSSAEFREAMRRLHHNQQQHPAVEVSNWNFESANEFQKCKFPWGHFYVCWNGFVVPCCAKPFPKELQFGNVFDRGMMNVLNSEAYRTFRAGWYKNQAPPFCDHCFYLDLKPVNL